MLARIRKAAEEREGGFTLIELLVVIIIIGILAAIAIPVFLNQRQKGYDAQAKSDARNIATLEETYMTDNNFYNAEADMTAAATDLGYKKSSNVTGVSVKAYDATGASKTDNTATASYCIDVTSASTKHFIYTSKNGGLSATATSCPATN
jgi:type IV pilus assembly protein PilA